MTSLVYTETIADRQFAMKRRALDLLLRLALTSEFPKVRRMAARLSKNVTRRVVRAARDVERQRAYERAFANVNRVIGFGSGPAPRQAYGQPGTWTGD